MTAMSERQLDALIEDARKALGIRLSYHTHDSRRSPAGFPDRVYCGPGGVLFRELKTDTGKLTLAQLDWLANLNAAGLNAGLWRPSDWPSLIWDQLRGIAKAKIS
jgi:hypothetical protein